MEKPEGRSIIMGQKVNGRLEEEFVMRARWLEGDKEPKWGHKVKVQRYACSCGTPACGHVEAAVLRKMKRGIEAADELLDDIPTLTKPGKYTCSCQIKFPEEERDGNCVHIRTLKYLEWETLSREREDVTRERSEGIAAQEKRVEEASSRLEEARRENEGMKSELESLRSAFQGAGESARQEAEARLKAKEAEYSSRLEEEKKLKLDSRRESRELQDRVLELEQVERMYGEEHTELMETHSAYRQEMLRLRAMVRAFRERDPESAPPEADYYSITSSVRSPREKMSRFYNDHQPKGMDRLVRKLALLPVIDDMHFGWQEESKSPTEIRGTYAPGKTMPNGREAPTWTVLVRYTDGDNHASPVYLQTLASNEQEASLITERIRSIIE